MAKIQPKVVNDEYLNVDDLRKYSGKYKQLGINPEKCSLAQLINKINNTQSQYKLNCTQDTKPKSNFEIEYPEDWQKMKDTFRKSIANFDTKLDGFLLELQNSNPRSVGKTLTGLFKGSFSIRFDKQNRLFYKVDDKNKKVLITCIMGHNN